MKIKDIINSHIDFGFADTKINFIVKPKGSKINYFNSESQYWRNNPEILEMKVERWMICDARGNKCKFILIVERDEEYEEKQKMAWENLLNR